MAAVTAARVMFNSGLPWPVGTSVTAQGTDVVIGTVIANGEASDGRLYAEIELTPAALGVGYERPSEAIEEDAFG